uniref:Uncharacterized protein n=1 Tax=Peronospora matthiolae TaxID=2874970 RepID=A0AAV1T3Z5_9STRA
MPTRGRERTAPWKKTCQLADTPDRDSSSDNDKENAENAVKADHKDTRARVAPAARRRRKGLSVRQQVGNSVGEAASQESPPKFVFKAKKTLFRKRKMLKLERQLQEEERNKKRIEDLVAYFQHLDEQKLETA